MIEVQVVLTIIGEDIDTLDQLVGIALFDEEICNNLLNGSLPEDIQKQLTPSVAAYLGGHIPIAATLKEWCQVVYGLSKSNPYTEAVVAQIKQERKRMGGQRNQDDDV